MKYLAHLLIVILIIFNVASGNEIFVSSHEFVTFAGNLTLLVEDVNPRAGVAWLKLCNENEILASRILNVGDNLAYDDEQIDINLSVTKIYAGGNGNLLAFKINSGEMVEKISRSKPVRLPEDKEDKSDKLKNLKFELVATLALVLMGWAMFKWRR